MKDFIERLIEIVTIENEKQLLSEGLSKNTPEFASAIKSVNSIRRINVWLNNTRTYSLLNLSELITFLGKNAIDVDFFALEFGGNSFDCSRFSLTFSSTRYIKLEVTGSEFFVAGMKNQFEELCKVAKLPWSPIWIIGNKIGLYFALAIIASFSITVLVGVIIGATFGNFLWTEFRIMPKEPSFLRLSILPLFIIIFYILIAFGDIALSRVFPSKQIEFGQGIALAKKAEDLRKLLFGAPVFLFIIGAIWEWIKKETGN